MFVGIASRSELARDMSSMLVSSTRMDSLPPGASRVFCALNAKKPSRSSPPWTVWHCQQSHSQRRQSGLPSCKCRTIRSANMGVGRQSALDKLQMFRASFSS